MMRKLSANGRTTSSQMRRSQPSEWINTSGKPSRKPSSRKCKPTKLPSSTTNCINTMLTTLCSRLLANSERQPGKPAKIWRQHTSRVIEVHFPDVTCRKQLSENCVRHLASQWGTDAKWTALPQPQVPLVIGLETGRSWSAPLLDHDGAVCRLLRPAAWRSSDRHFGWSCALERAC